MKHTQLILITIILLFSSHSLKVSAQPQKSKTADIDLTIRQLVEKGYPQGSLYLGLSSSKSMWTNPSTKSERYFNEFSYNTPENSFKQTAVYDDTDVSNGKWKSEEYTYFINKARENHQVIRCHGPISPQCNSWAMQDTRTAAELEANMTEYMTRLSTEMESNKDVVKWMDVVNETVSHGNIFGIGYDAKLTANSYEYKVGEWFGPRLGILSWENPWPIMGFEQGTFKGLPFSIPRYIVKAFEIANLYAPSIKKIINQQSNMESAMWSKVIDEALYLRSKGLRVDGIAWQAHIALGFEKNAANMTALNNLIDLCKANQLEFHISEFDVYVDNAATATVINQTKLDQTRLDQAATFGAIVEAFLKKLGNGAVGINFWGMCDEFFGHTTIAKLFDVNGNPNPSYTRVKELLIQYSTQNNAYITLPSWGDGTQNNPYKIGTAAEFETFRNMINSSAGLTYAAPTVYYELKNNIDLSAYKDWEPVGKDATNRFSANFDGKGYTISGLTVQYPYSTTRSRSTRINCGLFGVVNNGTIKNLNVTGIDIYTGITPTRPMIGGLAFQVDSTSLIENCSVQGAIDYLGTKNGFVGGIVGATLTGNSLIVNSSADMVINATSTGTSTYLFVGGVVGNNEAVATKIVNCFSNGVINGDCTANSNVGGIVGYSSGTSNGLKIINCYSSMSMYAAADVNILLGGIMGSVSGAVDKINNETNGCIALNEKLYGIYGLGTSNNINRISNSASYVVYSNNCGKTGMDSKKGVSRTAGATTVVTFDANTTSQGANLGLDPIADAVNKLNAYVYANPIYINANHQVNLYNWGVPPLLAYPQFNRFVTAAQKLNQLSTIQYLIKQGVLSFSNFENSRKLKVYSDTGKLVIDKMVSTEVKTELPNGNFIVVLEGYAPTKIISVR